MFISNKSFVMAVPKRKTSKSKRNMRRSHHSLKNINVIEDKESGEPRISHRIDLSTGMYKNRLMILTYEYNKSKANYLKALQIRKKILNIFYDI